jgi:hypothetical protein
MTNPVHNDQCDAMVLLIVDYDETFTIAMKKPAENPNNRHQEASTKERQQDIAMIFHSYLFLTQWVAAGELFDNADSRVF